MSKDRTNLDNEKGVLRDSLEKLADEEIHEVDEIFVGLIPWQGFLVLKDSFEQLQS